ncbi:MULTISPECIES: cell division regulator GpsB [Bacillota]|nr:MULTISPECIES: cell division regulator GpsB [Clostridia]MBS7429475.1 cell division regulator GpsB [Virgibacillus sp. 19R1-5]MBU8567847.1 cell division regulator GpsB [Virgibacillus pantothenticus]MBU8601640.1 cell division regulator GpsB [Virgibacillus pantothenticus]MBU8635893.1 cell division regulator GpsB [Virgibacillus pantothenticus]MBU8641391.1 cell division regulator GpsB [Virgibacillus pantothenticus]
MNQVHFTSKDILDKDFKTAMRGYNQEEVDEFLDLIIQDYDVFKQEIDRLQQENDQLRKVSSEKPKTRSVQTPPNHQVNYDVLKRLSNLEKAVFGKKFADSEG